MAKKQFFLIADSETTIKDTVADFGAVICDRKGVIHKQIGVMVHGHFDVYDLFYDNSAGNLWNRAGMEKRKANYMKMLNDGSRMLASVEAINKWINQAIGLYNPILTAYNLPFDLDKCKNTGIDLSGFSDKFCLWAAANGIICHTKAYRQFVMDNHLFNAPTELGNMTFKTNAESVAGFLTGQYAIEPHTALEDARDFELPILKKVVMTKGWREKTVSYDWRKHQVKDHFTAK
jgi:hypothetical protein